MSQRRVLDETDDARPPDKKAKSSTCTKMVCYNLHHYEAGEHDKSSCEMDVCGGVNHGPTRHSESDDPMTHYLLMSITKERQKSDKTRFRFH